MVDTPGLGPGGASCGGSSPSVRRIFFRRFSMASLISPFVCTKDTPLEKEWTLVMPANLVVSSVEKSLREKAKKVKMDGFRPGAIPLAKVFEQYGHQAINDAARSFIVRHIDEMVGSHILAKPVSFSIAQDMSMTSLETLKDLTITVTGIFRDKTPEVSFGDIEVDQYTFEPTDDIVNAYLSQEAAESFCPGEFGPDRDGQHKAQKGDFLLYTMVYEGKDSKKEVKGMFRLGDGKNVGLPEEFEENLINIEAGHVIEERMRVPKQFPDASLAGQKVNFRISFDDIKPAKPCSVDDEFARSKGFDSLEEMKKGLREQLISIFKSMSRDFERSLLKYTIGEKNLMAVAPLLLEEAFKRYWERNKIAKKTYSSPEEREKAFQEAYKMSEEEYKTYVRNRVQGALQVNQIIGDFIKKNEISVKKSDFEEIARRIRSFARETGENEEKVWNFFKENPDAMEGIIAELRQEKALDEMLGLCKRKEVVIKSIEEFRDTVKKRVEELQGFEANIEDNDEDDEDYDDEE